ncbi:MAG: RIO1 family regulatory kinase/ATPase [Caldilineaceae bacterium]
MSWKKEFESDVTEYYEAEFHPESAPEKLQKINHKAKKSKEIILKEISAETSGVEQGFHITYKPARFEEVWLFDSLRPFYERGLLADVLAQVKGGKEANVYLCRAKEETKLGLIAAKVYRPRQFRNLRNDIAYREGREFMAAAGGILRNRNTREMRAIKNKTEFGSELMHQSWLMHEYSTLDSLHQLGAAVPKPLATGENCILMEFFGAESQPAPVLHSVTLRPDEVEPLFNEVMRNIDLMLSKGMIHGDLSAYNILYWNGRVTLIDFPQVTLAMRNRNGYRIFQRDLQRVCEYFAMQGLHRNPRQIGDRLWQKHVNLPPDHRWDDPV